VQEVHENLVMSYVRSMLGGHTRTSHKLIRDSARSAQSEHKEFAYTPSSVKYQRNTVQRVRTRVTEKYEKSAQGLCKNSI
jgi:hypothetical protein